MSDSLLLSLILILLIGLIGGQVACKFGVPPLLGMMLGGILLGSEVSNLISESALNLADDLRTFAVMVILMRAGLGLDREKLVKQGSVALRLGFLPAVAEMIAISAIAMVLFQFDWLTGLLLGCVISAESPAVIVPGMLRLKNLGWGVSKGIADAILTGSALSDVFILLTFSLLISFLTEASFNSSQLWLLPVKMVAQIIFGIIIGYLAAKLIVFLAIKQKWTQNNIQNTLVTAGLALLAVVLAVRLPYFSGYLAVMAMGFFLIEFSPPLARRLRQEFNHLWIVAEILLFVLMGATIQLKTLGSVLLPGMLLLGLGLLLGRTVGWYLATLGSNWNWREKLFLLPGNSAKATVQAAIGAIPLSLGIPNGDIILAIAALSILITAPLGAWAIPTFAPRLLAQDKVDPSKVDTSNVTVILGVLEQVASANVVLAKVADLARRTNGEAIIVFSQNSSTNQFDDLELKLLSTKLLNDIPHRLAMVTDNLESETIKIAQTHQAIAIIVNAHESMGLGANKSLKQSILEKNMTDIPLMLVS